MIALTGGKTSIALVLFCERTRLLYETPAKVLEQFVEVFGIPRKYFALHGLRVVKRNLAGLFFITISTTRWWSSLIHFLFERQLGSKLAKIPPKNLNCTSRPEQKNQGNYHLLTWSFAGVVMKNNPAKFCFTTRKKQGAKFEISSACRWNQLVPRTWYLFARWYCCVVFSFLPLFPFVPDDIIVSS